MGNALAPRNHLLGWGPLFRELDRLWFDSPGNSLWRTLEFSPPRTNTFPPYNIVKVSDTELRLDVALVGYQKDDIQVSLDPEAGVLSISSEKVNDPADEGSEQQYLHRGIAARKFSLRFTVPPQLEVLGASMTNGMLSISCQYQEPEKPPVRQIEVT